MNTFEEARDIIIGFPNIEHYTNLEIGASFPVNFMGREGKVSVISIYGNEVKFRMDDSAYFIYGMVGNQLTNVLASTIKESNSSQLTKVLKELEQLEEKYNVSIISRGGAYGSSRLVIQDNKTGEELERG